MKNLFVLIIALFVSSISFSQKQKTMDEVHLKMGKILVGEIIETKPDEYIIFKPDTKDADKMYIEMKDVDKIVSITVEEEEKSKVRFSNFTSITSITNIRDERKTGRIGLDMVNGIYIPFKNDFAMDLGLGLGFTGNSNFSTLPIYLSTKLNKKINDDLTGFINLDLGFNSVVWSSDKSPVNSGDFFSFLGLGVKYKLFKYPLFFAKIGMRYEDFYSTYFYYDSYGNYIYNYPMFSTLNLQLNIGVNF